MKQKQNKITTTTTKTLNNLIFPSKLSQTQVIWASDFVAGSKLDAVNPLPMPRILKAITKGKNMHDLPHFHILKHIIHLKYNLFDTFGHPLLKRN